MILAILLSCQEYRVSSAPVVPPAEPPGKELDEGGEPPDWQDCFQGFHGTYHNLTLDDDFIEPRPNDEDAPTNPEGFDYWEQEVAFERFDPNLDFGAAWWPVDDGLEGDPAYYAVRWRGWLRAWSGTELSFTLGSADDSWVVIGGEQVASAPGIQPFEPATYTVSLDAGQMPVDIYYVHRSGESGFRFRVLSGDVSICYPNYERDPE